MTAAYTPLRGTIPDTIFKLLRAEPAGTELASAVLADRIGQKAYIVTASLAAARKHGAIIARPNMVLPGCPLMWSLPGPDYLLRRILPTAGAPEDEDDSQDKDALVQRVVPAGDGEGRPQSTWMPGVFVNERAPAADEAPRPRPAVKKPAPAPAPSPAAASVPRPRAASWAQPLTDAITSESNTPPKGAEAACAPVAPCGRDVATPNNGGAPQGLRLALWSDGMLVVERGGERHEYTRSETTAIVAYLERLGEATAA
jgi:hypothetical protein